jgi:hypothetical protein
VTTERKRAANRRNARSSTGPRTAAGKARVAQNALRHGLNVAVADDPLLTEEVERIAHAICDGVGRGGTRRAAEYPASQCADTASHRRHCERSEAIQSLRRGFWIASSASPPRNDESCFCDCGN